MNKEKEKEKKGNEFFKFSDKIKTPIIDSSTNISPYSLDISKTKGKKISEFQKSKYSLKSQNISTNSPFNEQYELNEKEQNNLKNIFLNLQKKLMSINNNINSNHKSIEKLKSSLNKLKQEKNNKKSEIVNLLSNKESLDEIYNNYLDYLKNKNKGIKIKDKKFNNIKSNPLDNQDEDAFEILISEIKESDLNKFIEQTFNFIEEIFDHPNQQLKVSLKDIINKSYSLFNNAITSSPFLDTYSIVSNFFLRISLFLSNQSNGKYSETIINLFLRCLLKMNSINAKNEKLINYMNTKYKEEKGKLKQEISSLINKNEILNKTKLFMEKQMKELEAQLKVGNNLEFEKINDNLNNIKDYNDFKYLINNKIIESKNIDYFQTEIKNEKNANRKYTSNNLYKKYEIKEKLKNKFKKVYKEDMVEMINNEVILNDNNINFKGSNLNDSINFKEQRIITNERKINEYNIYDNFIDKINNINLNYKDSINLNEIKNQNLIEISNDNLGSSQSYNNKYISKYKKGKEMDNKDVLIQSLENNIKKYNTINNYQGLSKRNIAKKDYISPQVNNKTQTYYKDNILNEKNFKNNNFNHKILERIYFNKKFKVANKQPKKKLNYHYYTKKINNKIISYSDVNKNMKCDLAKKIKYLDKVNKNNTNSTVQSKNISKNNKDKYFGEQNNKNKRLLTEKKEKKFKYNFFDIIQETNKKRNNSGETKFKHINNLNISNYRSNAKTKTEKARIFQNKDNYIKFKSNNNHDYIIKSDYINDRKKSYYEKNNFKISISNTKFIKNGIENENIYNNGSDSPYNKIELSFTNKNKICNENKKIKKNSIIINKNKKQEVNNLNKISLLNNRNQYYHYNKNTYNNSDKKEKSSNEYKFQTFKKEKNLNKILNKEIKKTNIYFIITESKNMGTNSNGYLGKLSKNENMNDQNSKSKSNRSEFSKNQNLDKGCNSCSKSKTKISNFNFNCKFNKTLLLKRSLSSTLNKLLNNNLRKKCIIDSYYEYNNSSSNNSFNVSNSLGVSYINNNKRIKEINSHIESQNKTKINKESIANLKIGLKNSVEINKDLNAKKKSKLNNIIKISSNNLTYEKEDYFSILREFKQNQKETFCYFKIFEKCCKNNKKFNPLENCSINPENFGYNEGYISFDINEIILTIKPKILDRQNSSYKKMNVGNELVSKINEINSNLHQNNNYDKNFNSNSKDCCLNIEIKDINEVDQTFIMSSIVKIHKIFLKYNSGKKNNLNNNSTNNSQKIDKKVLNLNKLIYVREIKEINMPQNEKIKAILCNYFSFSFLFGKYNNKKEIELIFINFEQYNLWNKFINTIIDLNQSYKIMYNKEEYLERKRSNNNSKDFSYTKGNIENGSNLNEEITKLSNNDIILNI